MTSYGLSIAESCKRQPGVDLLQWASSYLKKAGERGSIERVEITKCQAIEVQLTVGKNKKWLALGADGPEELVADSDKNIPLSRYLSKRGADAGLKILAYRPARRLVILDTSDTETVVIKGYRKGKGIKAASKFRLAAEACFDNEFITPGPIRFDQLHDSLTMPFLNGKRPHVSTDRADDFKLLGQGIMGLQQLEPGDGGLTGFRRQHELAVLDDRADRMRLADCIMPSGWDRLRDRIEQASEQVQKAAHVPTHRDLHDGQLLLTPDGMALLDFDLLCLAEPELDPANFLAHLVLRGLQRPDSISERSVQACGQKFLDGLSAYEREGFWERLRFYQATSFGRLALVYSLRPKWIFTVPVLVRLGHRCLDDLQRLVP